MIDDQTTTAIFLDLVWAMCRHPNECHIEVNVNRPMNELKFTLSPHQQDFGILLGKKEQRDPFGNPRTDSSGNPIKGGRMFNALNTLARYLAFSMHIETAKVVLNGGSKTERSEFQPFTGNPDWTSDALEELIRLAAAHLFPGPAMVTFTTAANSTTEVVLVVGHEAPEELAEALRRIFDCVGSAQGRKIALQIETNKEMVI